MAWHSKWANIQHRKWAQDSKKWKIFWKHSRLIEIAARWWSNPELNNSLAIAIENAKMENVPNDNIARAIKKWSWEWKDAAIFEEVTYEWYLAWWVAVIVTALTDNRNRTISNVRSQINKHWWNLWDSWSVSWIFINKWEIVINLNWKNLDEFEMFILESWANDFEISDEWDQAYIFAQDKDLGKVRDTIKKAWYEIEKAQLSWIPNQKIQIDNIDKAKALIKIIDILEDDDDVTWVYANFDFNDEIIESL